MRRKPAVLFVNTRSALGADVAVHFTLIQNFDPETVEVHLATNRHSVDAAKTDRLLRDVPGLRMRSMDLGHERGGGQGKLGKVKSGLKNFGACLSLLRLMVYVWRNRIDVIHSTDRPRDAAFATLLSKLTRRKNIVHCHIKWYPGMGGLTEWALRQCTVVLTISEFTKVSFIQGGISRTKVAMVYNSSESSKFCAASEPGSILHKTLNLASPTAIVGIVARIMRYKGQLELVRAFARVHSVLPDVHLAIIGNEDTLTSTDDYFGQVKSLVCDLGLEAWVHFPGWMENNASVMQGLTVLAMPSWEEPFGLVVTEAMLSELPVAGFRSGALPEIIVDGETGLLTPPLDTDAFADALLSLLQNPKRRQEMGRAGRERVIEHFSPKEKSAEVVSLYRAMIEGKFPLSEAQQAAPDNRKTQHPNP